ncbi:hypothetical protein [Paenibacillus ginsengarvi]|uniref:Uncharacterized protein n=1 Tax=Paenibacillus ginsengarvi TaxID=400777 RepID=A0A3B0BQA2_9BACL|nr:hypothetical protein [Paenibacillus ginsengarvi]RKN74207.1 hypothetical protein D7M11_27555 [Paenibacillus ginsengarvi]
MFDRRNSELFESGDSRLSERELADDPEALYDLEDGGDAEADGDGDTVYRFEGVAQFVNALYADQMDINEAMEHFRRGYDGAAGDE